MADRLLTPQQEKFLASYTDPKSDTFANAYQSALTAEYSKEYAEVITYQMPEWLSENLGDMKLLAKAEKILNKTLDYDAEVDGKVDTALLGIQNKTAHFVAERLNKRKYSIRTEMTGANGEKLTISFDNAFTNDNN